MKFLEIFRYLSTNYIETPRKTMYFASLVGLSQVVFQLPRGVCLHDGREECPSLILMKNAYFSHFYCLLEKMRTYCLLSSLNFHHGKVWKSCAIVGSSFSTKMVVSKLKPCEVLLVPDVRGGLCQLAVHTGSSDEAYRLDAPKM